MLQQNKDDSVLECICNVPYHMLPSRELHLQTLRLAAREAAGKVR